MQPIYDRPEGRKHPIIRVPTAASTVISTALDVAPPVRDRDWWQLEAVRLGSDWTAIMRLRNSVAPIVACDSCGLTPCADPSFCNMCRQADRQSRQRAARVPKNWDNMSIDALWSAVNDPRARPTPQITIDTLWYCIRERGVPALREPANVERMCRCDKDAREELNRRIANKMDTET
jgi:hypothetical protein